MKTSPEQLRVMVTARTPIIHVITHDENEFLKQVENIWDLEPATKEADKKTKETAEAKENSKVKANVFVWSSWAGIHPYFGEESLSPPQKASGVWEKSWNPSEALQQIVSYKSNDTHSIFIMRDMHTVLAQPITRQLRDMYQHMIDTFKTIVIVSSQLAHGPGGTTKGIEPTLEKQIAILHWALPSRQEIEAQVRLEIDNNDLGEKYKTQYSDTEYLEISRALQGLTPMEVQSSIAVSFTELKEIKAKRLLEEKKQIIMRSDILEYIDSKEEMNNVGGLDCLKEFINAHANLHSDEAVEFGAEPLKGILLLGIPGSGKSLAAKALGNQWKIPTLRLDVGKVMAGLVGQSESRMREALKTIQSVAPAVLWVDEIEKALSGTKSSNFSDGGTLARVFGTLLTEMEEGMKGVTVIATANSIESLPPELIRRFSEVFFVSIPTLVERKEIFGIHLKKKKRDPKNFDLDLLAEKSDKFTGAEIEKSLKEAISTRFNKDKGQVTNEDILIAMSLTKPIATLMKSDIDKIIDYARDRARFASSLAAEELGIGKQKVRTSGGKEIAIGSSLEDDDGPSLTKPKAKTRLATSK